MKLRPRKAGEAGANLGDLLAQAIDLVRSSRHAEADRALTAILRHWPEQPDALHFLGVLRHGQGRVEEALALVRRALEQAPDHGPMWSNLGNILLGAGRIDQAVEAYERSLQLTGDQPEAASPLNNLSTIYRKQGRLADAEAACRKAVNLVPDFAEGWYNLSLVLMDRGAVEEGVLASSRAIALWPSHLQARDQVIRALVLLGERDRAAALYREWLAEDPGNPVARHQLAACLGEQVPERASNAYVEQVFDAFAGSFDSKLEMLHYRAPGLVARALGEAAGEPRAALDIVDAGCGTGLCGPLVKPWARFLAGCDLSEGMLRCAVPRQVYDKLHKAELVHYLDTQPDRFEAIISADTLCYFGDLHAAMAASSRCLRPGGWVVFTVEALPEGAPEPHVLQSNGRYAHSQEHLVETIAAAGLRILAVQGEVLRHEAGRPVAGWLVSATKP
ncbi:MAG: tetratricopeptide repeat protein [Rubrivivax sp.]|nr:tetratricopeptide repeat protein [Rubrivivax sp.]